MNADLFTPISLGAIACPNRILMAPMTRNRAPATIANALMAEYYRQRSSAGLIISEGSQISPQGVGYPATPGIHSPEQVAGWRRVTDAVHAAGGRIVCQLWHCGRISHPSYHNGGLPVAPSAIRPAGQAFTYEGLKDFVAPRALTLSEIGDIATQFATATANAREAGFDGVEIHAANGYLIDQFLRDGTNRRTDAYGGSIANRTRFLLEVTRAVADAWAPERVGMHLSPLNPFNDIRDSNPQALFTHVVRELDRLGLAYLHVTEMGKEAPGAAGPYFDPFALRAIWHGPYITNAGYDKAQGNAVIAAGKADAVSYGRLFLANPDLPKRFRRDAPLTAPDESTFYGGDAKGYTDYPALLQD